MKTNENFPLMHNYFTINSVKEVGKKLHDESYIVLNQIKELEIKMKVFLRRIN